MNQKEEGYFSYVAKVDKIYRKFCDLVVAEYCFTPNEIVVMMFLANNPGFDSASDIAHYRNISKGLIARSVESLCEKGYLQADKDAKDRRLVHLHLTDKSGEIVKRLLECRRAFVAKLEQGVPQEDLDAVARASVIMAENLDSILKGIK